LLRLQLVAPLADFQRDQNFLVGIGRIFVVPKRHAVVRFIALRVAVAASLVAAGGESKVGKVGARIRVRLQE
jgi:hypothetical protein